MTSPAKFKKDKEIIAEYDTQVKGRNGFIFISSAVAVLTAIVGVCRRCLGGEGRNHLQIAWNLQGFFLTQCWIGFAMLLLVPMG